MSSDDFDGYMSFLTELRASLKRTLPEHLGAKSINQHLILVRAILVRTAAIEPAVVVRAAAAIPVPGRALGRLLAVAATISAAVSTVVTLHASAAVVPACLIMMTGVRKCGRSHQRRNRCRYCQLRS